MDTEITITRSNPHIDPNLTIWGWEIPGYLFLGGLTAGILILSGIFYLMKRDKELPFTVRTAPIFAPIFLSIGMLFLFLDLEHKLYVWRLYLTFKWTSPMSWGSWALILMFPSSILFALMQLEEENRQMLKNFFENLSPLRFVAGLLSKAFDLAERIKPYGKIIAWVNIVMGGFIGIYTGILISSFVARPFWNTSALGLLFLTSGISSASAFMILGSRNEIEKRLMIKIDVGFLVTELLILIQIFIGFFTSSAYHNNAGKLIFGGDFTGYFWMLVILQGILFPLFLEALELKKIFHFRILTPLSVLFGGLLLRILFVYIGQHSYIGLHL